MFVQIPAQQPGGTAPRLKAFQIGKCLAHRCIINRHDGDRTFRLRRDRLLPDRIIGTKLTILKNAGAGDAKHSTLSRRQMALGEFLRPVLILLSMNGHPLPVPLSLNLELVFPFFEQTTLRLQPNRQMVTEPLTANQMVRALTPPPARQPLPSRPAGVLPVWFRQSRGSGRGTGGTS